MNFRVVLSKDIFSIVMACTLCVVSSQVFGDEPLRVVEGAKVTIEYSIRLSDESLYYSNVGKTPLSFLQGSHAVVAGLEKAIMGMKAGDEKVLVIGKRDAYGPYSPLKQIRVEKKDAPTNLKVGQKLISPDNKKRAMVLEIYDTSVLLDFNHPLAGKDLTFEVTVLRVESP